MAQLKGMQHIKQQLEQFMTSAEPSPTGWYDAVCPLHKDQHRSAGFNFEDNRWRCHGGCGSGKLTQLVKDLEQDGSLATVTDIKTRTQRKRKSLPPPTPGQLEEWHERLIGQQSRVKFFKKERGLSVATLTKFQIGWDGGRYTLPIRDQSGAVVNVRTYLPDGEPKWIHWAGMSQHELFPAANLTHDTIVICEGELDALLNTQKGFPSVSGISGAKNWNARFNYLFKGKNVFICYDRDETGEAAARTVAENLEKIAATVRIITLPLPFSAKHGEDITDFYIKHGNKKQDFRKLMTDAPLWRESTQGAPEDILLRNSYDPENVGKVVAFNATINGRSDTPHTVPKNINMTCSQDAGKLCDFCPMNENDGRMLVTLQPNNRALLAMRDVGDNQVTETIRKEMQVQPCKKLRTEVQDHYNATTMSCRSNIDISDEIEGDTTNRHFVLISDGEVSDRTQTVRIVGTPYPAPHSQETTFMAWEMDQIDTSIDNFQLQPGEAKMLDKFRCKPGQSPLEKMEQRAKDLAANVTHIKGRPELHMAQDLVFHSVLDFMFDGKPVERGWLELLVIGDSRTGKSEIGSKLARYYQLGSLIACENTSIPGLLGAVVQSSGGSKGWSLEWGAFPVNDRRLLILDEVSGLPQESIGKLSSLRSTGEAEVIKARAHKTPARVRQIWLSNPRNNVNGMRDFRFGVEAVPPLIGNAEDIARFDFAMSVYSDEVSPELINRSETKVVPHVYDRESCHLLLKLAWSLKRNDVKWTADAEKEVFRLALIMGRSYSERPPLVQAASVRFKIARWATALAAITASYSDDYKQLIVTKEHVTDAVRFINRVYSSSFGYFQLSGVNRAADKAAIASMEEVKTYIKTRKNMFKFFGTVDQVFSKQQMQDIVDIDATEASSRISRLFRYGMLQTAENGNYRMSPYFNQLIKELKEE